MPRQRTPLHILKSQGTYRPNLHANRAPDPAMQLEGGFPKCPEHVTGIAREKWLELESKDIGVLTELDATALEIFCTLYAEFRADPSGMQSARIAQMNTLSNNLYLNAASRQKLDRRFEEEKPSNPFGQF